jgi:hypothetical protein
MPVTEDKLIYEGEVYVRPVGRGIVLEQEPRRPHLDDWVAEWLGDRHPGYLTGGCQERLRIVIERVDST